MKIVDILLLAKLEESRSKANQLVRQGGVRVDGSKADHEHDAPDHRRGHAAARSAPPLPHPLALST